MKNLLFFFFLLAAPTLGAAQNVNLALSVGVRKSFIFNKKSSLDLRQQFQVTPEIKKYNNESGDFFNEDGFWPVPDRYQEDDDNDDDDDDDLPPGAGNGNPINNGELNDTPREISFDWRSNTSLQYNYRFFPWIRSNTGYALLFDGEELRHTFRAELDYRPLRHSKQKKKVDLALRNLYQYVGNPDDGKYEWESVYIPRFDVEWTFKKNHLLQFSNALNGAWNKKGFEFDRWRVNTNLVFTYRKINRFTLGYQFQQRLDKPRKSHGINFSYEVRF